MVSNIFLFNPKLGKISNLTNISQMGSNHQPDNVKEMLQMMQQMGMGSGYVDPSQKGAKTGAFYRDWRAYELYGRFQSFPKSSILIGLSIIFTIHFGGPPLFLETSI